MSVALAEERVPRTPRAANFDRVARIYRWAEYLALGPLLQRCRTQFLPALEGKRSAHVLGDGDGRFSAALLRQAPSLDLLAIDSSRSMLRLLEKRCARDGNAARLTVQQDSALVASASPDSDLIATHFFLDCLSQEEVERLVAQLGKEVQPGCSWVISDFGLPRRPIARWLARIYIRLLYRAFRVLTGLQTQRLPDHRPAMRKAGFQLQARIEHLSGFLYAELWCMPERP